MEKTNTCPKCNYLNSDEPFSVCPKCGLIVKKYYDTLETRQKIEAERLEKRKIKEDEELERKKKEEEQLAILKAQQERRERIAQEMKRERLKRIQNKEQELQELRQEWTAVDYLKNFILKHKVAIVLSLFICLVILANISPSTKDAGNSYTSTQTTAGHSSLYEGTIITTKKMLYATPTEDDFNFLLKIRNDEEAMKQMLLNGRLVPFAPGAKFHIMDRNTSQDYVKIRQEGSLIELYTHSKFLE